MSQPGPALSKGEIARRLREASELLRLQGESPYRAGAYETGADALDAFGGDLGAAVEAGRLIELRGIGPSLAQTITDLWRTGESAALHKITGAVPPALRRLAMARIPGLTWRRLQALHDELGIATEEELHAAAASGVIETLKGMGPKTVERLRQALASEPAAAEPAQAAATPRMVLVEAFAAERRLLPRLRHLPGAEAVESAGELRRRCETVGGLDFVVATGRPAEALQAVAADSSVLSIAARDAHSCRIRLYDGTPVTVHVAPPERLGVALILATGSAAHVTKLDARARSAGTTLAELEGADEAAIYARLGLPFIPPELREDAGELEAAAAGDRFDDLIAEGDIRGLIHCHTVYSDGKHTIAEMARAADAMGMRYLTITDHSPTAFYARGLDVDRLHAQWEEIARVQETVSVRLLRGTESDILADGGLDYPDAILEQLDVVIASIHARHRMDADRMTRRLVRAMQHPCFKIWGHALGRLVLSRAPIECRVEEVLDAAAAGRAAIEINGDPARLDLEPRWIRAARARGLRFVVSTDAHSVDALANQRYGVAMARRGWVRRGEVLNTLDTEAFVRAVSPRGHA